MRGGGSELLKLVILLFVQKYSNWKREQGEKLNLNFLDFIANLSIIKCCYDRLSAFLSSLSTSDRPRIELFRFHLTSPCLTTINSSNYLSADL
jgi:hypothetical protein